MEKKSKGRQKVEMKKMPNESNLQVTFSKRRSGLFKKASELCTLTGAEIAIIVFSPGKKVFSFGHPSVDGVVNRYLSRNPPQPSPTTKLIEAHRNANINELNMQLTQVMDQLENDRKRGEELNRNQKANMERFWWYKPVEELDLSQVRQLKEAMLQLKKNISKQMDMFMIQNSQARQQFFGSSSNQPVIPYNSDNNEVFNNPGSGTTTQGFDNLGLGRGFF